MQFSATSLPKFEKKDGVEYEPGSLAVMQSTLDRHLKNAGKNTASCETANLKSQGNNLRGKQEN